MPRFGSKAPIPVNHTLYIAEKLNITLKITNKNGNTPAAGSDNALRINTAQGLIESFLQCTKAYIYKSLASTQTIHIKDEQSSQVATIVSKFKGVQLAVQINEVAPNTYDIHIKHSLEEFMSILKLAIEKNQALTDVANELDKPEENRPTITSRL